MDRTENLLRRLSAKEDSFTERKLDNENQREFRKTIVAFANSLRDGETGVLFIGVRDDGRAEGVPNTDKRQKAIRKICEQDCYPPIEPSPQMTVLQVEGVDVLAVEVMPSPKRPHFSGPAFVRRGSESVAASRELLDKMLTGHCGKAGTILKLAGQIVTVELIGRTLSGEQDPDHRAEIECVVSACTPHSVSFEHDRCRYSEPIEGFSLAEDVKYGRPYKLILKGDVQNAVSREKQARLDAVRLILHGFTPEEKDFVRWMLPRGEVPPSVVSNK